MSILNSPPASYAPPKSPLEILVCRLLLRSILKSKQIQVDFGYAHGGPSDPGDADFVLAPPKLWPTLKLMLAPNSWVGESFINGKWYLKKGNLSEFLHVSRRDAGAAFRKYYDLTSNFRGIRHYFGQHILNKYYTRKVKNHYEVDSKVYEMILDEEMLYTCAFFDQDTDTLADAQQNKLAATMARMAVPSGGARVLDIGCGWGAMARALVKRHPDVEVCGLSISKNQIDWAQRRDALCLSNSQISRIEYRLEDYVDHKRHDHYDAISAVGMIEHVGLGGYDKFFASIYNFLKRGGRAVIHTIVTPRSAAPTNNWIDKHIFTGGYAPSVSELTGAVERHPFQISGLYLHAAMNYKKTIELWIENYSKNAEKLRNYMNDINFSDEDAERFMRIWIFYLSGVRNMFVEERGEPSHQVLQMAITKT